MKLLTAAALSVAITTGTSAKDLPQDDTPPECFMQDELVVLSRDIGMCAAICKAWRNELRRGRLETARILFNAMATDCVEPNVISSIVYPVATSAAVCGGNMDHREYLLGIKRRLNHLGYDVVKLETSYLITRTEFGPEDNHLVDTLDDVEQWIENHTQRSKP